jgi:hypothetical protein
MHPRRLEHLLAIVAATLRQEFPEDFYKRCAYSAFATFSLLRDADVDALLVGGDFVAFIVSRDGRQASMQGFGFGDTQCSHFWVEAEGRLIDLGPHFLPEDTRFPAAPMPAVAWDLANPLPRSIRYRTIQRFPAEAEMSSDPIVQARCRTFIAKCRSRRNSQVNFLKFPTWIVTGKPSMTIATNRRDPWAVGADRFERLVVPQSIPF